MTCPHCAEETSPTYLYCERCGQQLQLDLDGVRETMERDALVDATELAELQTRGAFYFAIFFFVSVLAFRAVALREVVADAVPGYFLPFKALEDKNLEPPATLEVKPLPLEVPRD